MKAAATALLLLPALAGCALPGGDDPCDGRPPLTIHVYEDVVTPENVARFDVTLWNCAERRPLTVFAPCGQLAAFAPKLDHDGVRYALDHAGTFVPEDEAPCEPTHESIVVAPGQSTGMNGRSWDGRVFPPGADAPVRVPGEHSLYVEAAGYLARAVVAVPP